MHSKPLLIAVAAFVLTTSSAQAFFNDKEMKKAGFTEAQIEAFAEARELKKQGKLDEAKEVLLKVVKVDNKKIETLRENLSKDKDKKIKKDRKNGVDKEVKREKPTHLKNYDKNKEFKRWFGKNKNEVSGKKLEKEKNFKQISQKNQEKGS